ncbi:MAG TPA: hypothetical protein VFY68_02190, partial [Nitrososphaeraceae archaeon]|nr:hypothetical protein [Nitrososphaeraceae archaeon]
MTTIPSLPPSSGINKSEILYGVENAVGRGVYFMSNVMQRMDIFFDHRAPSIVVDIAEYRNGYIDIRRRGGKIRAFTEITKDNLRYCKELMKLVDELKHLDGVRGGIAVSESEYMATTVLQEAPLYLKHFSSIFEELWKNGISASDRIKEIQEGTEADIKVIHNPSLALDLYLDTVSSAKKEILLIFPTTNAFIRQQRTGVFHLLREIVQQQKVKVRILMPHHEMTVQTIENLKKSAEKDVDIRSIKQAENAMATFLVVDKKFSLVMEIKNDSKETFDES